MTSVLEAVEVLRESPDYRVLRRFIPDPAIYIDPPAADAKTELKAGVFFDVESTGLDTRTDRIVELASVPFSFDPATGIVHDAGKGIAYFNDPGFKIPPEVTAIHGITDDMVAGQAIDIARVEAIVADAQLVVAHSADYDRKMLERLSSVFRDKHWACSQREVEWDQVFGCRAAKLAIILGDACSQFFEGEHRALGDCHVGVNVLANAHDPAGETALWHLLHSARLQTCRVWARGSAFPKKDILKARGYLWSPGPEEGGRKCWYRDVRPSDVEEEVMFARDIAGANPEVVRFGAKDRYSVRVS